MIKKNFKIKNHSKYVVIFSIIALFLLFAVLLKTFTYKFSITGNAILETGNLNPSFALVTMIFISLYGALTCTYLKKRYHA